MGRYVKTPQGQMVEPYERYVKVGSQERPVVARYKKVNGVMQEIWPLYPGRPTITGVSFPFRNGRVELDITWTHPLAGPAPTDYLISLRIDHDGGSLNYLHSLAGSATSLTLTNSDFGYDWYGERNGRATVTLRAFNRKAGPADTFGPVSVSRTPIPAVPTYSMTVQDGKANHTWSHNGINTTHYELEMQVGGADPVRYTYPVGSTGATNRQPWNPLTVGNAFVSSKLRAVNASGASEWAVEEGIIPALPRIENARFENGQLIADITNITHDIYTYYHRGSWVQSTTLPYGGTHTVPESGAWPRNLNTITYFGVKGYNPYDNWTTALVQSKPLIKLPNPLDIEPTDSDIWRTNKGWTTGAWDNVTTWVGQGTEADGESLVGHFAYGTKFQQQIGPQRIGYYLHVSAARVNMQRKTTGGLTTAVRPRFWLHNHAVLPVDFPTRTGGYTSEALARGAGGWLSIPADWVEHLGHGNHRGLALHHENNVINKATGVTNEYFLGDGVNSPLRDGKKIGTVRIWHKG